MTPNPLRLPAAALVALSALATSWALASAARADIPNFSFVGIKGVGALDNQLDKRLGTTANAKEHIINSDDCERYVGGEIEVTVRIDPRPTGSWQYAVAYAPPGKTCSTSDANPQAIDGQCYVPAAQRELNASTITFIVNLDSLIGAECQANTEGDATIYVIIQNTSISDVKFQTIIVDVDLRAPSAPTLDELVSGDARFVARWSDANTETGLKYVVYYSDAPFGEDDLDAVDSRSGIATKSIAIDSGLSNEVTYYVSVAARDAADNESALSNQLEVTPASTTDFWEAYQQAGGSDPGGFCFIATAAYGTPLEAELGTLRRFRDDLLLHSEAGRWLVARYYQIGRFWAAYIADKPVLRAIVRIMLVPLVWFAELVLTLGPEGALLALLALWAGLRHLRQHARRHTPLISARAAFARRTTGNLWESR
jgi:hypothetical protein